MHSTELCKETQSKVKNADYDKNEWIYRELPDSSARFVLGKVGSNPLVCFGINPSTGSPGDLDDTLKRVESFALANGYDSFVMLNVYALRCTEPVGLPMKVDKGLHAQNLSEIKDFIAGRDLDIWAAWGTAIKKRPYLKACLSDIAMLDECANCRWVNIGNLTGDGHPHHPVGLAYDSDIENFDIASYVRGLTAKC